MSERAGIILGSQGERLGVSHGLKTLIVFESQQRLYVKVPSHWTTRKNLQEEREEKKKKTNHTQLSFA